jgi:hypothetical protein
MHATPRLVTSSTPLSTLVCVVKHQPMTWRESALSTRPYIEVEVEEDAGSAIVAATAAAVRTNKYCPPRHRHASCPCPCFLEFHGIL